MKLSLDPSRNLNVETSLVSLLGAQPVVDGLILEDRPVEVLDNDRGIRLRYAPPALQGGAFLLEAHHPDPASRVWLRYWLEGLPTDRRLDSFGLRFKGVENLRAYLRQGYFSWDGSFYLQPEALAGLEDGDSHLLSGYAMTQLLPRHARGAVVLGFDRHDRFQQTFTFDLHDPAPALTILTFWDQKDWEPKDHSNLARCESERLVIFERPAVEESLREWARLVAAASPLPPRLSAPRLTGWCSWYNLYAYINEENILEHLRGVEKVVKQEGLPMRVFQIDDGFTPEMGDWLEVRPQFPRGVRPLMAEIKKAGFIPGLWIAPFLVGNRSHLFHDHPDWVVQDRRSGGPLVGWRLYGEFRWHKRSEEYYVLDATHPEAFDHLREVFRTWRWDWGCEYFKTDFMHFGSQHGPDRARWHAPGLTRIEIWRRVAEMIREEIGGDALWLGCGCPLWASVGLVDAVRIGGDVGVEWTGQHSAQSLLRDLPARNFANQVLWQTDPDCILLRNQFHYLTDGEVRSLALFAGLSGGVLMTSDALDLLSADRLHLWRLLLHLKGSACDFPLLGQTEFYLEQLPAGTSGHALPPVSRPFDPVIVQRRNPDGPDATGALFILNTSDSPVQRTYSVGELGIQGPVHIYDWTSARPWDAPVENISVTLPQHAGRLLFFSRSELVAPPDRLP